MRTALSTIQQTLTAEAASVLTNSIADASRRHHGQTTPLHVAATLLAAPAGLLRQACARSHPNSSHPLQCRALELCFSVALDRLPSTSSGGGGPTQSPPLSNALVAALKRAQAHQRRGCPETQQQPLLAVKVELEQLVLSILDDPSVSRVMREASFSSTAVKSTIEQSLSSSSTTTSTTATTIQSSVLPNLPNSRNLYLNPRLQPQKGAAFGGADPQKRENEVTKVVEIMLRSKKRNPILVGDSDPDAVLKEVVRKIESGEVPPPLRDAQVVSLEAEFASVSDKSQVPARIQELGSSIDARIGDRGVVLNLGDLKWLVEAPAAAGAGALSAIGPVQPQPQVVSEAGRAAVTEMGRLLKRFNGGELWLVGVATCATYLRCQVYHRAMENDWDLQAVPIAARTPLSNLFPRPGANGILSSSVETLAPMKGFAALGGAAVAMPMRRPPLLESMDASTTPGRAAAMCHLCTGSYERELAKISAEEAEKSSSKPHWLQLGSLGNGGGDVKSASGHLQAKEQEIKKSSDELQKKWREACARLHPGFHSPAISMPSATLTAPKLALSKGVNSLQMNTTWEKPLLSSSLERRKTPPGSPVKTDLVLGHAKFGDSSPEKPPGDRRLDSDDYPGCTQDKLSDQQKAKIAGISDIESFKRLFKGLSEKVSWQPDAASAIAAVVLQCKSGNGKLRAVGSKCGSWLLFVGPDKVGKRKMAAALSELVCGSGPVVVNFSGGGGGGEANMGFWGKTSLDRVVEAVRRNPFSLVVLEDIDRADAVVRGKIKRAMERGRLPDSHGREVSLGSVIFILTASWLPEELNRSHESLIQSEEKILDAANSSWQLELSAGERAVKHRADWLCDDGRATKARKDSPGSLGLSLDLNLAVGAEDESGEGSRNSSDVTVEHEHDKGRLTVKCLMPSPVAELLELVDDAIVFRPVDFRPLRKEVVECISAKSEAIIGAGHSVKVDDDALDRIIGAVWLTGVEFEEWAQKVLVPSIKQLKSNLNSHDRTSVLRLSLSRNTEMQRKKGSGGDGLGLGLPTTVAVIVNGL